MWYMNIPKTARDKITVEGQRRPGHATLVSYATSQDGVEWHKPKLNLVDYEGSTANNMVGPDMYNPEGFSVLFEPHDPDPARKYKAFYWDHGYGPLIMHKGQEIYGSGPKDGMHVAFSPDGTHWRPYEKNPVMKLGSDTGQVVLYDPDIERYVAYGRFGAGGRKVARSESKDFIHWSKPVLVLQPDAKDGPNTQFYGISIDLYEGIYVGLLWMFWIEEGNVGRIDFQLCHSRDGKSWIRDPQRRVFLPNGPEGSWDSLDMRAACRSVVVEDRILIYYAGSAAKHGKGGETNVGMDVGLATLRRDGWVSLDAGNAVGTLTTKTFVHPGGTLHLNADTSQGAVIAQIQDAAGQALPGYDRGELQATDAISARVEFSAAEREGLAGRPVKLQFMMKNAKLFSFWFE